MERQTPIFYHRFVRTKLFNATVAMATKRKGLRNFRALPCHTPRLSRIIDVS